MQRPPLGPLFFLQQGIRRIANFRRNLEKNPTLKVVTNPSPACVGAGWGWSPVSGSAWIGKRMGQPCAGLLWEVEGWQSVSSFLLCFGVFLIFFLCVCGVFKIGVCYGHGVPTTQHPPQSQQWGTWETRSPGHHSTSPTSALHPWQDQHESSHGGLVGSGAAICSPAFLAKPSCVFPTCTSAGCTLIFAFHIWFSLWLIIFSITLPGDQRMGYLCAPQKLYLT